MLYKIYCSVTRRVEFRRDIIVKESKVWDWNKSQSKPSSVLTNELTSEDILDSEGDFKSEDELGFEGDYPLETQPREPLFPSLKRQTYPPLNTSAAAPCVAITSTTRPPSILFFSPTKTPHPLPRLLQLNNLPFPHLPLFVPHLLPLSYIILPTLFIVGPPPK